jgi:hypothetical protein
MPQYAKLRDYVSHRITFDFDTGARLVGYVTACQPPAGQVQLVNLTRVEILDATGRLMESHDSLSVVPNALVGVRVTEGPSGRE